MFKHYKRIFKKGDKILDDPWERIFHSIYKKLLPPETIEWFPAYLCNSNCLYCGGYDQEAISHFKEMVSLENILEIIRVSGEQGAKVWNIGGRGGEPLLYPHILQALQEIKRHNMQGIIITNGLTLNRYNVKVIFDIKWDILRISLDSCYPHVHDTLRGVKGNFRIIDEALDELKSLKQNSNSSFPYVVCCPVISNMNCRHMPEYVEYCIKKKVEEIQFMPLIEVHDRAKRLRLSDEDKRYLVDSLTAIRGESRIKHNIDFIISLYSFHSKAADSNKQPSGGRTNKLRSLYCIHLWKTLVISEDGYLSPCSLIKERLVKIENDYFKVWDSPKMNALRKRILRGEIINPACIECCGPLKEETRKFNNYLRSKEKDGCI